MSGIHFLRLRVRIRCGAHPASNPIAKLTSHIHPVLRLRIRASVPPLLPYVFMASCLFKHRDRLPTRPVVKMSTRNIPGGKGGRCVRLTTCHHTVPLSRNLGALTSLDPSGPAWPVTGVLYLYLYLTVYFIFTVLS